MINSGTIKGGAGGTSYLSAVPNANGGTGVYLSGATLETNGTISGGLAGAITAQSSSIAGTPGSAIEFGTTPSTLIVDLSAVFNGYISGFALHDSIDMTDLTPSQVLADFNGTQFGADPVLTTTATQNEGTLQFQGSFAGEDFVFTPDASGTGTDITVAEEGAACYRRGTRIFTPRGEIAIECLKIGDSVLTLARDFMQIRWIGRRHYSGAHAERNTEVLPIKICQGAFGYRLPKRDLWVSPGHAMYLDGMLIAARDLVNGSSIVQVESVDEISYFHLEFDSHAVIYAEGALAESFADDESRALFDNAAEYHDLHPDAPSKPPGYCAPRLEEGWKLERVCRRLAMNGASEPFAAVARVVHRWPVDSCASVDERH